MSLKKNRKVNRGEQPQNINIPSNGLRVHLQGYGWIHVFRFESKNGRTEYIGTNLPEPSIGQVKEYVRRRIGTSRCIIENSSRLADLRAHYESISEESYWAVDFMLDGTSRETYSGKYVYL